MTCVPNNANKRESYLLYEKSGKHLFRRLSSKHKQSYYFKILHQTSGEFLFWLSKKHRLRIICRVGHCSDDWRQTCGRELVWHTHTQSHLSTHLDFVKTPLLSCVDKTPNDSAGEKWAKIRQAPLDTFQSKDTLACSLLWQLSPVFRSSVVMLRFSLDPVILNDWIQERTTLENV